MIAKITQHQMKRTKDVLKTQHAHQIISNARKRTSVWNPTGFVMVIMIAVIILMKILCIARRELVPKIASGVPITDVYQRHGKMCFQTTLLEVISIFFKVLRW